MRYQLTPISCRPWLLNEDAAKVEPPRPLVQEEFGDLPGVSVEEVKAMLETGKPVQIVDARPRRTMSRKEMEGAIKPIAEESPEIEA